VHFSEQMATEGGLGDAWRSLASGTDEVPGPGHVLTVASPPPAQEHIHNRPSPDEGEPEQQYIERGGVHGLPLDSDLTDAINTWRHCNPRGAAGSIPQKGGYGFPYR
jgi:hypothetical protein